MYDTGGNKKQQEREKKREGKKKVKQLRNIEIRNR